MSETLRRILLLVEKGEIRISDHGYDELAEDDIFARDVVVGARDAEVVEEYPNYSKGPCVLALQRDGEGMSYGVFRKVALHLPW